VALEAGPQIRINLSFRGSAGRVLQTSGAKTQFYALEVRMWARMCGSTAKGYGHGGLDQHRPRGAHNAATRPGPNCSGDSAGGLTQRSGRAAKSDRRVAFVFFFPFLPKVRLAIEVRYLFVEPEPVDIPSGQLLFA
jgi:hypothetical protein